MAGNGEVQNTVLTEGSDFSRISSPLEESLPFNDCKPGLKLSGLQREARRPDGFNP